MVSDIGGNEMSSCSVGGWDTQQLRNLCQLEMAARQCKNIFPGILSRGECNLVGQRNETVGILFYFHAVSQHITEYRRDILAIA